MAEACRWRGTNRIKLLSFRVGASLMTGFPDGETVLVDARSVTEPMVRGLLGIMGLCCGVKGMRPRLNHVVRNPSGSTKKFHVYVKKGSGTVKVSFGDPNMRIKKQYPGHRKSFRARHHCDTNPGPKWKARYWSCKMW